ncbi:MAG: hypothetical protein FWD18_02400 [Micrococcales bacterium]|nr:hypothetical protein [Micrococcales bacterium]
MIQLLAEILPQAALLAADSSDGDGGELALLLAGPASGIAFYWFVYRHYRNIDKSHDFERKTAIGAKPVQGWEQKIDTIKGTRERNTKGRNESTHRTRVKRVE